MAPEIWEGRYSDIYSLGYILWDMFCNTREPTAFPKDEVTEATRSLLRSMIEDNPKKRPDIDQVASQLGQIIEGDHLMQERLESEMQEAVQLKRQKEEKSSERQRVIDECRMREELRMLLMAQPIVVLRPSSVSGPFGGPFGDPFVSSVSGHLVAHLVTIW